MYSAQYLQHSDGDWEVVGGDSRLIRTSVKLHPDVVAALASVDRTPVDARLLIAVRNGLQRRWEQQGVAR